MSKKIEKIKESMNIPLIVAPMFLISSPQMVVESCKEGVIGTFPALNARTSSELENWMKYIIKSLEAESKVNPLKKISPWGMNFIAHKSNERYKSDLEVVKKYKPPLVITSLGDPSPIVKVVHAYGGIVFSDVINLKFAKKAIDKGSDGLILISNGAGGHGGELNPFAFMNEVKKIFDGIIVLAGAMSKGKDVLAAEILGADFVYMGSNFISVNESLAHEKYKNMIIDSNIEDIIYTDIFSGVKGNYLIPSIKRAGIDPDNLKNIDEYRFNNKVVSGVKEWKEIWGAGQGIGTITKKESIKEVIKKISIDYQNSRHNITF